MASIKIQKWVTNAYKDISVADDTARELLDILIKQKPQSVSVASKSFRFQYDGFTISIPPDFAYDWKRSPSNYSHSLKSYDFIIKEIVQLVDKDRDISIRVCHHKVESSIRQDHARVTFDGRNLNLYVKSQDGKWIREDNMWGCKAVEILKFLTAGLKKPAPLTKNQILEAGIPKPHVFDTDDKLTEERHGRVYIRSGLLASIQVEGVVTINDDRTIKNAIKPDGTSAWFQINCHTNIRGFEFTVISDGEVYHILTSINGKLKIIESTVINSYLDAKNMTKIDQTMVKEAIERFAKTVMG